MCSQRAFLKIKMLILRQADKQPVCAQLYGVCEH